MKILAAFLGALRIAAPVITNAPSNTNDGAVVTTDAAPDLATNEAECGSMPKVQGSVANGSIPAGKACASDAACASVGGEQAGPGSR